MIHHHHTKGIILKKYPRSENEYAVTFYSPDLGKIQAIAKGARKIKSSFSGHLETLNICNFLLYKSHERFTIIQCQTEKNFKNIRADLQKSILALLFVEILEKSTHGEEEGKGLYELMEKTLQHLSNNPQDFLTMETFKLKLLNLAGVLPEIKHCSFCHKIFHEEIGIALSQDGQLICEACQSQKTTLKIDFKIIKLINYLLQENSLQPKINLSKEQKIALKKISDLFLYKYLNREIMSEKIISQLQLHQFGTL